MVEIKTHKIIRTFGEDLPEQLLEAAAKEAEEQPGKFVLLMGNREKVDAPKVSKREKNIKIMFEFTEIAQAHTWGIMLAPRSKN